MAKNTTATVEVLVDGAQAAKSVKELEGYVRKLRAEWRNAEEGTEQYIKASQGLNQTQERVNKLKNELKDMSKSFAPGSIEALDHEVKKLEADLNKLPRSAKDFAEKTKELQKVKREFQDLRHEIDGTGGVFKQITNEIGKVGVLAAGYVGFQALTGQIGDIISKNAKMSDSFADIEKTTGLTNAAVKELNSEFGKIDTRTGRSELLGLAEIAGKLGISAKEDVLEFVKAADQINVALGKDLGDAEAAINSIGKLTDIFKIKEDFGIEQSMLKVGSAINALGAAGTANEAYLVEFAKRFGGIAPNANISIADVLGLAATMDELGQTAEVSTTSLGQMFVSLGKDIPTFAKLAGKSTTEFSELLKRDANGALMAVLAGAKSTTGGLEGLGETFEKLGVQGARGGAVIGVLANNLELLQKRQALANLEFEMGISLTEEFDKKNQNLAAEIDKLKKDFASALTSKTLNDAVLYLVVGLQKLISVIKVLPQFWREYKAAIILAATAMAAFKFSESYVGFLKIGVGLRTMAREAIEAAKAQVMNSGAFAMASRAQIANAAATNLVSAAWMRLRAAFMANPLGFILTAVTLIATAFLALKNNMEEVVETQSEFSKLQQDIAENTAKETAEVGALFRQLVNTNKGSKERADLIEKINSKYGTTLQNLDDEQKFLGQIKGAYDEIISSMKKKIIIESSGTSLSNLIKEELQLRKIIEGQKGMIRPETNLPSNPIVQQMERDKIKLEQNLAAQKQILAEQDRLLNQAGGNKTETKDSGNNDAAGDKLTAAQKARIALYRQYIDSARGMEYELTKEEEKELKKRIKEATAANKEKLKLAKKDIKEELDFEKTIAIQRKKELQESLANVNDFYSQQRNNLKQQYARGTIDKATYEAGLLQLEKDRLNRLIQEYADYEKSGVKAEEEITDAIIREKEAQIQAERNALKTRLEVQIDAAKDGSEQQFELQKELAMQVFEWEMENAKLTEEEKLAIREQFAQQWSEKEGEFQKQSILKQAEQLRQVGDYLSNFYGYYDQVKTNRENADLASDKKVNDKKKENLKKQLDSKQISEEQYNQQVAQLDEEYDRKHREITIRQNERQRMAARFNAFISGAAAIMRIAADVPKVDFGVTTALLIAAQVGLTAAQIAAIDSQPVPEIATGGDTHQIVRGLSNRTYNARKVGSFAGGGDYREASYGIIGEAGPELVIPNWLYEHPAMVDTMGLLRGMIQTREFAAGGQTMSAPVSIPVSSGNGDAVAAALHEVSAVLQTMAGLLVQVKQSLDNPAPVDARISYDKFTKEFQEIEDTQLGADIS